MNNDASHNLMSSMSMDTNYPYYKNIKTPDEIGMSSKGTLSALGNDINGLSAYINVLVAGKSEASRTGEPLGNKYFLKTGAKCTDTKTNDLVDRYMYIDNVPEGNIPIISSGAGTNFSDFRGLIPGILSNLNNLNPFEISDAFKAGTNPPCQPITMQTINNQNEKGTQTQFVALADIKYLDPCTFPDKKNPVTNIKCKESFTNMNEGSSIIVDEDPVIQSYLTSIGLLGIYILYCLIKKRT